VEAHDHRAQRRDGLHAAWRDLKATRGVRNRDAAELLGVSEAELVASAVGRGATRLCGDMRDMIRQAGTLGPVMALTRNHACVHEKTGPYLNVSWNGQVGLALGEAIDLRLFFSQWRHAYALSEMSPRGTLRSLQFFDPAGEAVHKIYLRDASNLDAYLALVDAFTAPDQSPYERLTPYAADAAGEPADDDVDVSGLRRAWSDLKDTHDFFGLLKQFKVSRTQGLRLAGFDFAYPAPREAARQLLERAALTGLPIMVFVGNRGCIQIHTGPIVNVKVLDDWLNVLDPDFNLHLRAGAVAASWVVKKPTVDGIVTSLELYDARGETIAMLFGKRKPGTPEMDPWRALVDELFPVPDPQ
jgi:putative hemin transport protein